MNKRILAAALAVCLLFCACAHAEDARDTMKLMDIDDNGFWREHSEIKKESIWYDWRVETLTTLRELKPDLFVIRTYNDDYAAIRDSGMLADLSGSEVMREMVSRMHPDAQRLVTTQDGRILGVPALLLVRPFYWYQDAWDEAGLSAADLPTSYTELLDFLDGWVARVKARPEKNVCVTRMLRWGGEIAEKYRYTNWLMATLVHSWAMQQRHAGQAIDFNTPEFVALAQRTLEVGKRLYEAEPREKKRQKMLQLFQNDLYGGEHSNDSRDYGLSHSLPMRVNADQPMLMKADMDIWCVREGSAWLEEATQYIEYSGANQLFFFNYGLYTDFEPGTYAYDDGEQVAITAGWLKDLREYEGELDFSPFVTGDGYWELLLEFYKGKLNAGELAARLGSEVE